MIWHLAPVAGAKLHFSSKLLSQRSCAVVPKHFYCVIVFQLCIYVFRKSGLQDMHYRLVVIPQHVVIFLFIVKPKEICNFSAFGMQLLI